jgi:hypothetical protein
MAEKNDPNGAHFEIIVDGKPRSYRDLKAVAIEAAVFLKECRPTQDVSVRDLRDGTISSIGWRSGSAFVTHRPQGATLVLQRAPSSAGRPCPCAQRAGNPLGVAVSTLLRNDGVLAHIVADLEDLLRHQLCLQLTRSGLGVLELGVHLEPVKDRRLIRHGRRRYHEGSHLQRAAGTRPGAPSASSTAVHHDLLVSLDSTATACAILI